MAKSDSKKHLFQSEERLGLIKKIFSEDKRVNVVSWKGLTVDYAKENKINVLVRGLRPTGDFDNEFQMALMNRNLGPNIETVFLVSDEMKSYIRSSLVREIWGHNADVSEFIPETVLEALRKKNEAK